MKGDELEKRVKKFARRARGVAKRIPRGERGAAHTAEQLLGSSTGARSAYLEARGAESAKDFIHKISVGLKELRETEGWLEDVAEDGWAEEDLINELLDEVDQLIRIFFASRATAKKNLDD